MVKDKKVEGVVLSGVGESYAGGSYRIWEAQVQNKIGVVRVGLLADVSGADAQDVVVFEDPPQESPGRVVVFSVVDGGGRGQIFGAIGALFLSVLVCILEPAVPRLGV